MSWPWPAEGWPAKGAKVRFLNKNGHDFELDAARKVLREGQVLTVKHCDIGDWSSKYQFEEVEGRFNTVMFEEIKP